MATALSFPAYAADRPLQKSGETLPMKAARDLRIETTNGSWMSLDLSPDGRTLVFDILGDLYTMPVGGGRARQITHGLGFDTQPFFSPDGRSIAFISDRSGADNLWVAHPDGTAARQISFGDDDTVLASPAWSADGTAVFLSRYRPDLNHYELWRYGLNGAQTELAPIRATADAQRDTWRSTLGASASRDGKWLYFARRVGGLNYDAVDAWTIMRRDLASGAEMPVIAGSGGRGADHETFFRPLISSDGGQLAYGTRRDGQTELHVRDLATGLDRRVAIADPDQLQSAMWQDIVPRFAFTPDGGALIISRNGGFERISLGNGLATAIPFKVSLKVAVGPSTRVRIREDSGPVRARLIQAPIASPDGKRLAFSALGSIYVQPINGSAPPSRLPIVGDPAFQPGWSPDGHTIVFVTWSERDGGAIWSIPADGSMPPIRVSDVPAYYSYPVFAPDGRTVVAVRSSQAARLHTTFEYGQLRDAELIALPASGGLARVLTRGKLGGRPQFTSAANTVYILASDGLNAVNLASGARTLVAQVKGPGWYFQDGPVAVDDLRISPDGRWMLAEIAQQLHLIAMPAPGKMVDLLDDAAPHRRLTDIGVDYFEWGMTPSGDTSIDWSVGSDFRRLPLAHALPIAKASIPKPATTLDMVVEAPRDRPSGSLLLRGGRVLTMASGDRIVDDADVLITNDRVTAIGPRGSIALPSGTTIRDVSGKTILPGFIDVHDHIGEVRRNVLSFEDWGLRARLAYGVTTSFDPSTLSIDMLAYQDLLDTGQMLGPRLRSTGQAIFSMNRFRSLDEVRAVLRRYRDAYGLHNIKEYRTGNRRVRQWMAMAAGELGLLPTTEGALSMKLDLTQIQDGFAGNEHALAAVPLGNDVITLLKDMRTSYTTTLMVSNSGPEGADWFASRYDPQGDPKLRRFWPSVAIEQKLLSRPGRSLSEYRFPLVAKGAAAVQDAGGLVGMGAHGEVPGVGFHWEMEAHAMGGMTPMAVLHAATAGSAETIGRLDDLGTIEQGKLADLVILDRDPLADIGNTQAIGEVMRGGRLYGAATLAEEWPTPRPAPRPWFADAPAEQWLPLSITP